jgi:zinc transport system permease protein
MAGTQLMQTLLALALPYPFDRRYLQLALVAAIAVGACAPLVGTFLVERRMSLMGDGIGHIAFAGVAAGLVFNVWPVWTALLAAVIGALIMEFLRSSGRAQGDLSLAVLLHGGVGIGLLLAGAAKSYDASLLSYLFGSILTVTNSEALTMFGLAIVVGALVIWQWRRLLVVVSDPDFARTIPVNVRLVDLSIAVGASLVIVAAMRVVGLLLVASMMVLPVGAARQVAGSFRTLLLMSSLLGALTAFGGLWIAIAKDWPPGATIVVVSTALVLALSVIGTMSRRSSRASVA